MPAMWPPAPGEERTITKGRAGAVGRGKLCVTSAVVGECGRRCYLSCGNERAVRQRSGAAQVSRWPLRWHRALPTTFRLGE